MNLFNRSTVFFILIFSAFYCHNFTFAQVISFEKSSSYAQTNTIKIFKENVALTPKKDHDYLSLGSSEKLSADWWGFRDVLASNGVEIEIVYKGEFFSSVSGGVERGTKLLDNYDFIINNNLETLIGLEKSSFLIQFLGNTGGAPSELSGTILGVSNIETYPTWKLYQLLFESKLLDEQLSVMFGLYDLNSEFDTRQSSSLFLNPSHGIGPDFAFSGTNGPSIFSTTSLAFRLKYQNESGLYLQSAAFDGVPGNPENPNGTHVILKKEDGFLLANEIGVEFQNDGNYQGKAALGVWTYTQGMETHNSLMSGGANTSTANSYGVYFTGETKLLENIGMSENTLFSFVRVGYANPDVNPINYYFGCGLTMNGVFMQENELGLAFSYAKISQSFIEMTMKNENTSVAQSEINIELTYSLNLTPWLGIQPNLQYIINPAYAVGQNNSLMLGSRVTINL